MSTSFAMNNGIHHSSPRCMWPTLAMIIVSGRVSRSCDQMRPAQPAQAPGQPDTSHICSVQRRCRNQRKATLGCEYLAMSAVSIPGGGWRWLEVAGGGWRWLEVGRSNTRHTAAAVDHRRFLRSPGVYSVQSWAGRGRGT